MNASAHRVFSAAERWTWCRRLAAMSFAFFLAKGLLWLAVPVVLYLLG